MRPSCRRTVLDQARRQSVRQCIFENTTESQNIFPTSALERPQSARQLILECTLHNFCMTSEQENVDNLLGSAALNEKKNTSMRVTISAKIITVLTRYRPIVLELI